MMNNQEFNERTKQQVEIMQAYLDGKTIRYRKQDSNEWHYFAEFMCFDPCWDWKNSVYEVVSFQQDIDDIIEYFNFDNVFKIIKEFDIPWDWDKLKPYDEYFNLPEIVDEDEPTDDNQDAESEDTSDDTVDEDNTEVEVFDKEKYITEKYVDLLKDEARKLLNKVAYEKIDEGVTIQENKFIASCDRQNKLSLSFVPYKIEVCN